MSMAAIMRKTKKNTSAGHGGQARAGRPLAMKGASAKLGQQFNILINSTMFIHIYKEVLYCELKNNNNRAGFEPSTFASTVERITTAADTS